MQHNDYRPFYIPHLQKIEAERGHRRRASNANGPPLRSIPQHRFGIEQIFRGPRLGTKKPIGLPLHRNDDAQ